MIEDSTSAETIAQTFPVCRPKAQPTEREGKKKKKERKGKKKKMEREEKKKPNWTGARPFPPTQSGTLRCAGTQRPSPGPGQPAHGAGVSSPAPRQPGGLPAVSPCGAESPRERARSLEPPAKLSEYLSGAPFVLLLWYFGRKITKMQLLSCCSVSIGVWVQGKATPHMTPGPEPLARSGGTVRMHPGAKQTP